MQVRRGQLCILLCSVALRGPREPGMTRSALNETRRRQMLRNCGPIAAWLPPGCPSVAIRAQGTQRPDDLQAQAECAALNCSDRSRVCYLVYPDGPRRVTSSAQTDDSRRAVRAWCMDQPYQPVSDSKQVSLPLRTSGALISARMHRCTRLGAWAHSGAAI